MRPIRNHQVQSLYVLPFRSGLIAICLLSTLLAFGHCQELRESTDPYFDAKKPAHQKDQPADNLRSDLTAQFENNATYTRYVPPAKPPLPKQEPAKKETPQSKNVHLLSPLEAGENSQDRVSQATYLATPARPGTSFEPSHLLAVVGTEPIFVGDLMLEVNQTIENFMPSAPADLKQQQRPMLIERLLPKYIEQKLLLVDTLRQLPEEVDFESIVEQAVKEFDNNAMEKMMEAFGATSTNEFDAVLRAQGSSLRKLRRSWSIDQLVRFFLKQKIQADDEISHADMLEYYHEHIDQYAFSARCRWQQVMVKFSEAGSRSSAQEKIVEMGNQIVYGASMDAVAKKESHGFRASGGGIHDWTNQGSLVSNKLDEAIFTLPIGVLSDVIETDRGFHIVRVIERTEAGTKPFLDAQVEIREKLAAEKQAEMIQEHMKKLREEIPVEIYGLSSND
ncbi:MAG: peptidyl-prolyl cis-trans isomerase [Mariniblastus sp.]|nr:peptidyl-prolyl cis-trans isomerase [Mariniblastus sp.]